MRELGPHAIAQTMPDRPVLGFMVQRIVDIGGVNRLFFVFINATLWMFFAIEAALLFQKFFPEVKHYSIVAACLTLAPIVIQTQLSTIIVVLPASLPTILCYAGILILLRDTDVEKSNAGLSVGVAAPLIAAGIAISEYGVAANLVGFVLLIGAASMAVGAARRRLLISAGWVLPVTLAAYVLFTKIVNLGERPSVAPTHVLQSVLSKWIEVPFDLIAGTWRATIAAYATALSTITIAYDSKSTIIGSFVGFVMAGLLYFGTRPQSNGMTEENHWDEPIKRRAVFLILAILAGLAPVRLMGRPTTLTEFGSRFLIPIMPAAATLTLALALRLSNRRFRCVPVAVCGLIIGYATWSFTYATLGRHRTIAALSTVLQPYVTQSDGYTVVVVPFERFESELTATVAATWLPELEKRLWVVSESTGKSKFGDRGTCPPGLALDAENRRVIRRGRLDRILWIEFRSGKPTTVEPYCLFTTAPALTQLH